MSLEMKQQKKIYRNKIAFETVLCAIFAYKQGVFVNNNFHNTKTIKSYINVVFMYLLYSAV